MTYVYQRQGTVEEEAIFESIYELRKQKQKEYYSNPSEELEKEIQALLLQEVEAFKPFGFIY